MVLDLVGGAYVKTCQKLLAMKGRMLAQGLYNACSQGKTSVDDRLEAVVQEFAKNGVSIDRPHLNAGSRDEYELPELQEQVQVA